MEKNKNVNTSLPKNPVPRVVKFIVTDSRTVVSRGQRDEELLFNGYRVSVGENEKVLDMDGGDGCTTM